MKQQHIVLFFFVLLASSFLASARYRMGPAAYFEQGGDVENVIDRSLLESHLESTDDNINELPVLEESEKRMMEEAHLDYIYTGGPTFPPGSKHIHAEGPVFPPGF